jgi:hypothetical protein
MILDEVQTGIGRTGRWFAFQDSGIRPDAMTLAKGLGGGVPIGALITFGGAVSGLLAPGMHGSTFGGNPLAATAGLTVLDVIARDDLLANARRVGDGFADAVRALGHPLVTEVRGRGLLRAIGLAGDFAAKAAASAREAGFLVNAVTPNALRIAPPLIISAKKIAAFVDALGFSTPPRPDHDSRQSATPESTSSVCRCATSSKTTTSPRRSRPRCCSWPRCAKGRTLQPTARSRARRSSPSSSTSRRCAPRPRSRRSPIYGRVTR